MTENKNKKREFYVEFEQAIIMARMLGDSVLEPDNRNRVFERGYRFINYVVSNTMKHYLGVGEYSDFHASLMCYIISDLFPKIQWYRGVGEIITYMVSSISGCAKNISKREFKRREVVAESEEAFKRQYQRNTNTDNPEALAIWEEFSRDKECLEAEFIALCSDDTSRDIASVYMARKIKCQKNVE